MLQFRRLRVVWAAVLIAGHGSPFAHAQSRTTLSVSAVVVPHCLVAAKATTVSLSCSGHAARTARTLVVGRPGVSRARVEDPNRLDASWSGPTPAESLLVIDF